MSATEERESQRSYHGQPVLKEPVWTWEIPTYLFTGGLAGASAGLAYFSELRGNELLGRRAWGISLLSVSVSPLLLSSDLGRPLRFINMLRMFKITSPMSVGSWILTASGTSIGFASAHAWLGSFPRIAKFARPAAAFAGLPLSTYTAPLLANTAVPVWHEASVLLPFVFASGAGLSAGAAGVLATPPSDAGPARRLALAGGVLELALKETMEKRLGELGEPYKRGTAARFSHASRICIAAGAALLYGRGATSRRAAAAAGALLCAGGLAARWSAFKAGFQSAADPEYVVGPQRRLIERGERRGAARREARVTADPAKGSPATVVR